MPATRTTAGENGSGVRPGGPGRAPGAPLPVVGSTQRAAARNRSRMAAGVLVMLVCALGVGLAFSRATNRVPVLIVARPVPVGQVIENADLKTSDVAVDAEGATVAASRRSEIVGQPAAVTLTPGALLARAQVASGPVPAATEAVVGANLKDGQFPVGLAEGDKVLAVPLPSEAADSVGSANAPNPVAARVVAIRPLADEGGVAVSLAVAPDKAPTLAVAGARSRLSLVLAPR